MKNKNFDEMYNSFFNNDEFSKLIESFFGSLPKNKKIVILPNGSIVSTWTSSSSNSSETINENNINVLKEELQKSIDSENYEKAAQIRDLIKQKQRKDEDLIEKEKILFSKLEDAVKSGDIEKSKDLISKIESIRKSTN